MFSLQKDMSVELRDAGVQYACLVLLTGHREPDHTMQLTCGKHNL